MRLTEEAWRSVTDSLPKPGADVIAGYRDTAGRWCSVRAVYAAERSVVCTCERDGDCFCEMDDTGESWWPEGWYEIADNAYDVNTWRIRGTVTHWMPLPAPPGENVVREALDAIKKAHEAVDDLCNGRRWTMSIPARPDADHDLVIGDALTKAERVIRALADVPTAAGAPEEGAGEREQEECVWRAMPTGGWHSACGRNVLLLPVDSLCTCGRSICPDTSEEGAGA